MACGGAVKNLSRKRERQKDHEGEKTEGRKDSGKACFVQESEWPVQVWPLKG